MNSIKKYIIGLIVSIIIILIILLILYNKSDSNDIDENNITTGQIFAKENKLKKIESKYDYLNVKTALERYSYYLTNLYYASTKNNEEEYEDIESCQKNILGMIPDFVKEKLQIDENNIFQKIGWKEDYYVRIEEMLVSKQTISEEAYNEDTNIEAYIVKGVLINKNNYNKSTFNIVILFDKINNTFYVIPQEYIINQNINFSENNNLLLYDKEKIEKNEYNYLYMYDNEDIDKQICQDYLNLFKHNLMYDTEYVYNLFSEEYKKQRFGNYNNFINYIENEKNEINKVRLKEYQINYNSNNTEYVCKDQFGNLYIFEQTTPMEFTLKLDTYTIPTTKFKETYGNADEEKKVQMNVDKFIQMINRHDYKTSYNCISQGFKNNYFNTQEQFENYVKNTFFTYNKFNFKNITESGNNLYICVLDIEDATGKISEVRTINIIMKLNDNLDFEMSFSV